MLDSNEIIQREILPNLIDTVIYDTMLPFTQNFREEGAIDGDRITTKTRLSHTSNAGFFDKSDVDVASSTQVLKKPYWTKVFSQGMAEVSGIDMSNNSMNSANMDLIADAITKEVEAVSAVNYAAMFTQIKKDVDSTSVAYSDASLSRSTYPTLASYEEATNATITLAYMRGMIQNVILNKPVSLSDYLCLTEGSVYYTFKPLAAAVNGWNGVNTNTPQSMGYPEVGDFEGLAVAPPTMFPNMTTGDVLMLRRQDVKITPHLKLSIVPKDSERFSSKYAIYMGWNVHVDNPYYQGKMKDKD